LKELADLLARYSVAVVAVAPPLDALVLGEFHVPANGVPPVADAVKRRLINRPNSFNGSSRCREALISPLSTLQLSTLHPSTLNRSPRTIDLFLRLGIDLRRKNMAKRRHGFWRRFEDQLE
jgi:hypothetical protein